MCFSQLQVTTVHYLEMKKIQMKENRVRGKKLTRNIISQATRKGQRVDWVTSRKYSAKSTENYKTIIVNILL